MPSRLAHHVAAHPVRLVITLWVTLLLSFAILGATLVSTFIRVDQSACEEVNELRRQIIIAAADLGADETVILRFVPSNCSVIP